MQAIGKKLRPYVQCCHYICKGFHHYVGAFSSRLTFGQMESSEGASGSIEATPQPSPSQEWAGGSSCSTDAAWYAGSHTRWAREFPCTGRARPSAGEFAVRFVDSQKQWAISPVAYFYCC